jgi:hypothetical protein
MDFPHADLPLAPARGRLISERGSGSGLFRIQQAGTLFSAPPHLFNAEAANPATAHLRVLSPIPVHAVDSV